MKKLIITTSLYILLCSGCSPTQQAPVTADNPGVPSGEQSASQADADVTIPSILIGDELTQLDADNTASDNGDGTVTYALKGEEINEILNHIAQNISDSIQNILDDNDRYPNITAITSDDGYTTFTISLSDGQMSIYESMLVMSFYTIGNRYQIYSGVPADQAVTTVIYINAADNTVISKTDSTSVENFSPQ